MSDLGQLTGNLSETGRIRDQLKLVRRFQPEKEFLARAATRELRELADVLLEELESGPLGGDSEVFIPSASLPYAVQDVLEAPKLNPHLWRWKERMDRNESLESRRIAAMAARFYLDPETGEPHSYRHAVEEAEVEEVLRRPIEDRPGHDGARVALGQTASGRYLRVVYVPDSPRGSEFVITAFEPGPKTVKALRRRRRRSR